ncbi:helix-turn-helix domain-containing protein [Mesorhizobium muleiense]|uniref:helix-turn-helix domain-containing protein n=1 Tax=Mesorhizobium muleiense TaxID=1004279 RepID=UPI003AFA7EF1
MTKISVNLHDAVAMSGISRSALYKLFKAGSIIPRKNGKRTLVLVEDLERYVKALPASEGLTIEHS